GVPRTAAKWALAVSSLAIAPSTHELVLGRYRPVRPLGSGGSGSVWLACDERTGLDVALKIIPREGKAAARAEREALAARRLRHERCVRAYDVGHDSSHVYIAYEYVAGRTLRETMRTDGLSDDDAVEVAAQVLDALAHAHRTGIVHRDVKPSNLLLEERDEIAVRLLDFGLAQFDGADTLTAVGDVPGTLAYIAPERLQGAEATPESDVWAVGVLLWEALAGRHPFWGVPLQEVARAIEAGAPPLIAERRDLPRRLVAVVDGALAPNPERRPRASALASDLRSAIRKDAPRQARNRPQATAVPATDPRELGRRFAPVGLAAVSAALGATLLPFWPPVLVVAITLVAALAAWRLPRVGLAVALAAPLFPLGNVAEGAAVLYGLLALGWIAVSWRDARWGLLFITGPLLAPLGLLALAPLAIQPARGIVRRAAQTMLAVVAAAVVAGVAGNDLPLTGAPLDGFAISPQDSVGEIAAALWQAALLDPVLLVGAVALGLAAAALPWVLRRSRYGVPALGVVLTAVSVIAGAGLTGTLLVALVWAIAAAISSGTRK
ncbi:MAG: serine/threonine protein kinase, partial [Actinomycetota bacterium]|nr:serine/threonine protein kinase [Actinomycetota bacterium]